MWKLIESINEPKIKIGTKVLIYNLLNEELPSQKELELNGDVFEITEIYLDRIKIEFHINNNKLTRYIETDDIKNKKCWIYE